MLDNTYEAAAKLTKLISCPINVLYMLIITIQKLLLYPKEITYPKEVEAHKHPHTEPTMVHIQVFCMLTWQPLSRWRPLSSTRRRAWYLCRGLRHWKGHQDRDILNKNLIGVKMKKHKISHCRNHSRVKSKIYRHFNKRWRD